MIDFGSIAQNVFVKTRDFYTGGAKLSNWTATGGLPGKSFNKLRVTSPNDLSTVDDTDLSKLDPVFEARRAVALSGLAQKARRDMPISIPALRGQLLVKRNTKGANCLELACVAAFYAWEKLNRESPAKQVAVCQVSAPADHVWCLVGSANAIAELHGKTLKEVKTKAALADRVYAVDAWVNLVCSMNLYSEQVALKMDKWTSAGKRVYWRGPQQNAPGYYAPKGDYATAFANAKLSVCLALDNLAFNPWGSPHSI